MGFAPEKICFAFQGVNVSKDIYRRFINSGHEGKASDKDKENESLAAKGAWKICAPPDTWNRYGGRGGHTCRTLLTIY